MNQLEAEFSTNSWSFNISISHGCITRMLRIKFGRSSVDKNPLAPKKLLQIINLHGLNIRNTKGNKLPCLQFECPVKIYKNDFLGSGDFSVGVP